MRATSTTINVLGIFSPSIAGHRRHKYRQSRRQVRARRKHLRPGFLRCPPPPKKPRVEAVPATLADTPQPRACKHVTDHVWDPVREYQLRKPPATRPDGGYRIAKDFECHT